MVQERAFKRIAMACLAIAIVVGVTSGFGVFARGTGATEQATSIRGEKFVYATDGVYAFNAERVVAEGVGWDMVTLFLAVPGLLLALGAVSKGSLRGRLVAIGILGYFVYQYLMYAVYWALGPLFPLFIVIYAASFAAIVWIVSTIDIRGLSARFSERFPARGMAVFSTVMGLLILGMWVVRIAKGLSGDIAGAGLMGTPTLAVQALDLGIIVPIALFTAVLVSRRAAWGYLLGPVFAIKGVSMSAALVAMLLSAAVTEGSLEVVPFAIFSAATVWAAWLAWRMVGSVRSEGAVDPVAEIAGAH